jgi:D-threo-aldose 1-dehydrogenase
MGDDDMRTGRLGRTDVAVTEVGFGSAAIGNLYTSTDDASAAAAVHAAWGAGVRYFDTAPHYGLGLAEQRLGRALAAYPREQYIVSTKVGRLLVPNPAPTGSDLHTGMFAVPDTLTRRLDYSRDGVRRSLETSLQRLGLDHIDVALVHDPDDFVDQAISEAIPALIELREQGVIGAVGVGMNQWQAPLRIVREADLDAVMLAGRWTLVDRSGEPLLAECERRGVSVIAAAPYNSGLLANDWPSDDSYFDYGPAPADVLARARALARVAERHGSTLPQLAMQFPLRHTATASVVVGMRSPEEAASSVARLTTPVVEDVWTDIESRTSTDT